MTLSGEGEQQTVDKEYLRGFDGFESVVCYGISFFQKKALVKRLKVPGGEASL